MRHSICVSLVIVVVILSYASSAELSWVVKSNERTIDLTSQIAKITNKLVLENTGASALKEVLLLDESDSTSTTSWSQVQISGKKDVLQLNKISHPNGLAWHVELPDAVPAKRTVILIYTSHLINAIVPYPEKITQKEKQLVRYIGYVHMPSLYPTDKTTTTVSLGSKNWESYTKLKPHSTADQSIVYGPFTKLSPLANEQFEAHYENNSPFLIVKDLTRTIEISHWGNIAVEETVHLVHNGAILKGSFSRYDFQRESSYSPSVKNFKTLLPASASGIYYRDEIGNISTSSTRVMKDAVEVDLRPRFPLFGGWQTRYTIGYNVPSYEYLFHDGQGKFVLQMRLLDHIFDDMIVERLTVNVVLPEGSTNLKLDIPYPVERLPDGRRYTYLDTRGRGRPVVTVTKTNLVESHIREFSLEYRFSRVLMLVEPVLLITALFIFFLAVIIYVRLDFTISKEESSGEAKWKSSGLGDKFLQLNKKRMTVYSAAFDALKASKGPSAVSAAYKIFTADYNAATNQINEFMIKVKSDAPELQEKINQIQKLEKSLRSICTSYYDAIKSAKNVSSEVESGFFNKKTDVMNKINAVCKSME